MCKIISISTDHIYGMAWMKAPEGQVYSWLSDLSPKLTQRSYTNSLYSQGKGWNFNSWGFLWP